MAIHRRTYHPYTGPLTPQRARFRVIARRELRLALKQRWVRWLLLGSLIPLIGHIVSLYVQRVVQRVTGLGLWTGSLFSSLYEAQIFFIVLIMAVVGSDLIAKDVRANAHALYFSRPLNRAQYIIGKLLCVWLLLLGLVLVPGVILDLAQLLLAEDKDAGQFAVKLVQVAVYGAILASVGAAIIGALSSFGVRARYVGLGWVALYLVTAGVSEVLYEATGGAEWTKLLSIQELFLGAGRLLFDTRSPGPQALIVLLLIGALGLEVLRRRVRTLERKEA